MMRQTSESRATRVVGLEEGLLVMGGRDGEEMQKSKGNKKGGGWGGRDEEGTKERGNCAVLVVLCCAVLCSALLCWTWTELLVGSGT